MGREDLSVWEALGRELLLGLPEEQEVHVVVLWLLLMVVKLALLVQV